MHAAEVALSPFYLADGFLRRDDPFVDQQLECRRLEGQTALTCASNLWRVLSICSHNRLISGSEALVIRSDQTIRGEAFNCQ